MDENKNLKIKDWASEDRPREKFLNKGRAALTNAELLAILLSTGTKTLTAVDLAKQILVKVDNDINKLAALSIKDLTKINGVGPAKALTIAAALELGRRRTDIDKTIEPQFKSSSQVYEHLKPYMLDLDREEFWIILTNRANYHIKTIQLSSGGLVGTQVDPRIIFRLALEHKALGIILAHNHPSGNLSPSNEDRKITEKIKQGAKILDIEVLDHIIFTNNAYYSFADEGEI
jgi:DNA repair protein RadC